MPLDDRRPGSSAASPAPAGRRAGSNGDRSRSAGSRYHVNESSGSRRPSGESPAIKIEAATSQVPRRRPPAVSVGAGCSGRTIAGGFSGQRRVETLDQFRTSVRLVAAVGLVGFDVVGRGFTGRKAGLAPGLVDRILVGGERRRSEPSPKHAATPSAKRARASADCRRARVRRISEQTSGGSTAVRRRVATDAELPSRERFARIPLALAVLDQSAGRERGRATAAASSWASFRLACAVGRRCSTRRPPCRRWRRRWARRPS